MNLWNGSYSTGRAKKEVFPRCRKRQQEHIKTITYSIARKERNVKMFEYEISDKAIDSFYGEYERNTWGTEYDEDDPFFDPEPEDYEEMLAL